MPRCWLWTKRCQKMIIALETVVMSRLKDGCLLSQALKCIARLLIVGRIPPWRLVDILSNVEATFDPPTEGFI